MAFSFGTGFFCFLNIYKFRSKNLKQHTPSSLTFQPKHAIFISNGTLIYMTWWNIRSWKTISTIIN